MLQEDFEAIDYESKLWIDQLRITFQGLKQNN